MSDDADLTLIVAELNCADEAAQIEGVLGRLAAVRQVRTAVGANKVFVTYDSERIAPAAIRKAVEQLGMTVREDRLPLVRRRTSLTSLASALFVTAVALVALVGILGERLGLLDAIVDRLPPWLTLRAVLVGGLPIFRNVLRALKNRTVTSHALMTLGIVGNLSREGLPTVWPSSTAQSARSRSQPKRLPVRTVAPLGRVQHLHPPPLHANDPPLGR